MIQESTKLSICKGRNFDEMIRPPFALRESMQNLKKGHSHLTLPLMRGFLLTFFFEINGS